MSFDVHGFALALWAWRCHFVFFEVSVYVLPLTPITHSRTILIGSIP